MLGDTSAVTGRISLIISPQDVAGGGHSTVHNHRVAADLPEIDMFPIGPVCGTSCHHSFIVVVSGYLVSPELSSTTTNLNRHIFSECHAPHITQDFFHPHSSFSTTS